MKNDVIVLQHVANDGLGILLDVFQERNRCLRCLFVGDDFESMTEEAELLILLGGPFSVNQEDQYPFLSKEIAVLKKRIFRDQATFGICLGAQLIAKAAGAKVYPMGSEELGWSRLELSYAGKQSFLNHLQGSPVFHWHQDMFELPTHGELLASTSICCNQAFQLGRKILGVQFHIEATAEKIAVLVPGKWPFLHAGYEVTPLCMIEESKSAKLALHHWLDSINA